MLVLLLTLYISFATKAEVINLLPNCVSQECFDNPTNIAISKDGSFFIVLDSGGNPYIRKSNFESGNVTASTIITLNEDNPDKTTLKFGLSPDDKKAFVLGRSTTTLSGRKDLLNQAVGQGTTCNCPSLTYFDGTVCVTGTITCTGFSNDTVCGCDNNNYLNICIAQSNGIKTFTKGGCSTSTSVFCNKDDQCPLGNCSNGMTFKQFTCSLTNACALASFSTDPCLSSSSSSSSSSSGTIEDDCSCATGNTFNGTTCTSGTIDCTGLPTDTICGCDNNSYLNLCIARANGIKKFTKGGCGTSSSVFCSNDDQCPIGTCSNGLKFEQFTCTENMCVLVEFTEDPCTTSSSSGGIIETFSVVHIINLQNNKINTFIPKLDGTTQNLTSASFLDSQGDRIIASNDNEDSPEFLVIDTETGEITENIISPGIAKSIELSPNLKKAVITFKDDLSQSIGFFNTKSRKIFKLDTPSSIIFDVDEFLSGVDFDLSGNRAAVSSLGGRHVLHLLDIENNGLIIKFLDKEKEFEGQTLSTISPDGRTTISVGNVTETNEIVVYKINVTKLFRLKLVKSVKFDNVTDTLDVAITPDNNNVLILISKENEKRVIVLSLENLSQLCEYKVSDDTLSGSLFIDPLGRYLLTQNSNDSSVSLITSLELGPVFQSIEPNTVSRKGGTEFTINGFIDTSRFTENVEVCFKNKKTCATSVTISSDGKTITGKSPKFKRKTKSPIPLTLSTENKTDGSQTTSSSSGFVQCTKQSNTQSRYKGIFKFR